jgi:hypothetical protein
VHKLHPGNFKRWHVKKSKILAGLKGFVAVDTVLLISYEAVKLTILHPFIGVPVIIMTLAGGVGAGFMMEDHERKERKKIRGY